MKKDDFKTQAKFKLSVEEVDKLISAYILPKYPYLGYNVKQSDVSNSVYVYFQYENTHRSLRISDHKTMLSIPSLYVTRNTKKGNVVRFIMNQVKALFDSSLKHHLNNITDSLKQI